MMQTIEITTRKNLRITFLAAASFAAIINIASMATADGPAPLGQDAMIRLGWTQWQHWTDDTPPKGGTDLLDGLANVGVNVFADWGPNKKMGLHARKLGIRYYGVQASVNVRGPAAANKIRLAVDKWGLTCPEQFEKKKAAGGDVTSGWNDYGEGSPAYIPCPLEPLPWQEAFFGNVILRGAKEGWLDGYAFDIEPYGAYKFDQPTDTLCYCDHCFAMYQDTQAQVPDLPRNKRFEYLVDKRLIVEYLTLLRQHRINMFKKLVEPIWKINPQFGFAVYPDFKVAEVRADWGLQSVAYGLHSEQAPFLVVDATPYWEDHLRPWWEQRHNAYRKAGFKHVLGSWDAMMASYSYMDVGAEQANYEFAMGSDGYWRWGERTFNPLDWRMFAQVNQRLRQREAKMGDFLLRGQLVHPFATVIEDTGDTHLERAIVANTYKDGKRYLTRVSNGNVDWPVQVRVRFPRVPQGRWRLVDAVNDMVWVQPDGTPTWDAQALHDGLTVTLRGRDELFMLIEPANYTNSKPAPRDTTKSFDVTVHLPRPAATEPLPEPSGTLADSEFVFTRTYNGPGYQGATAGGGLLTRLAAVNTQDHSVRDVFGYAGYVREPEIAPDRKHVAAACWTNGKAQIYLINAVGGKVRNISNNDFRDRTPVFRPDGQRLAFISDRSGDWDIYTMALDGSDVQRLTDSHATDKMPNWSPDGQRIVFVSDREGGYDVYTMNADGSEQRLLLPRDGNEYEPTWSPDGKHIVCTVQRRWNRCFQISEPDGGDPHYVALGNVTNIWSICWSPDGQKLAAAYSHLANGGVVTVDRNDRVSIGQEDWGGKLLTKLIDVPPMSTMHGGWYHTGAGSPRAIARLFSGVRYTPDGKSLIYCSNQPGIVSPTQAGERLAQMIADKQAEIDTLPEDQRQERDATHEAANSLVGAARAISGFRLFRISVDGGDPEELAGTNTDWPTVIR